MPTKDPEKKKAQRKRWVEAHPEQAREARKRWLEGNTDRAEKQRQYLAAYRARQKMKSDGGNA